jgi:pSer/pThr/pTyr-binding forkhead associated (FHA) protein/MFS family permease
MILISVCLALATVMSAVSSLNVALPAIAKATGATGTQLQWIIDAYALSFAGLVLPAGAFGDRIGRRRALIAGLTVFGIAAACAMTVNGPNALIAARVAMGVGAALTMPTTLSIISTTFRADALDQAVTIWTAVAGASALVGALIAGTLLQFFSWQAAFALNIVLAALAIAMALAFVPSEGSESVKLDIGGAILSALGLSGVVWGFIEGPSLGWTDPRVLAGFIGGAFLLGAFVWWEGRSDEPMLDPGLFVLRGFSAGSASIFVQFFAIYGVIFVAFQYFEFVLRYRPLGAALAFAPFVLGLVGAGRNLPRLMRRFGMRGVGPFGLALMGVAVALGALTATSSASYLQLLPVVVLLGAGAGLAGPPATALIIASLPHEKQGVASAVNDTAREVGGALGIAIFGSVLTASGGHLGHHLNVSQFVTGYSTALYVGAAVILLLAILIALRAPALITLIVTAGPRAGERIGLNDPQILGRAGEIRFDDPELSRRHLALRPKPDGLEVEDLGSSNGTFVRGVRIKSRVTVRDGAVINVGQSEMTVKLPATDAGATKMMAVRPRRAPAPPASGPPAAAPPISASTPAVSAPAPEVAPAVSSPTADPPAVETASAKLLTTILVTSGPRAQERITLVGPLTIGRGGVDIVIDDPELSRRHAALRPVPGGVEVRDLGSSNGTFLDGTRISSPETAAEGDTIRVGATTLRVELMAESD